MAALTMLRGESPDLDKFAGHIVENLPVYAWPYFLRLCETADTTSSFKQVKTNLQKQGFDPKTIRDPLYFLHPRSKTFLKMTPELYDDIQGAKIRF